MLTPDELTDALKKGQAQADCCDHWCRVGGTVEDNLLVLHHNHIGSDKTDVQRVHANAVLGLGVDALAGKIKGWVAGLHKRERVDLNAAMTEDADEYRPDYVRLIAERPIRPEYLVGERDCETVHSPVLFGRGWRMQITDCVTGRK